MTTPLSTGSVPLTDYTDALRWLREALKWLDGVTPPPENDDSDEENTRLSQAFLELYPSAAVQLDLLASIEHARLVKSSTPEEYDDARR